MTLGERIANLRKSSAYSQEYVAEQLGVSRQAVSKWEKDLSSPDTENLIKLSELLNTSVQFLATGKDYRSPETKPFLKKNKTKITKKLVFKIVIIIICAILVFAASAYVIIGLFGSVRIDSAAYSGDYRSFLSEKYSKELAEKFLDSIKNSEERYPSYVSATILNENTEMNSYTRDVWLKCTVNCKTESGNEYGYSVTFKGKRIWYDTYEWTNVSINGNYGNPYIFSKNP